MYGRKLLCVFRVERKKRVLVSVDREMASKRQRTKNPRKENFASASGLPNGTTGRVLAVAYTRK
jgi:hypothetical protein